MQKLKSLRPWSFVGMVSLSAILFLSGCEAEDAGKPAAAAPAAAATAPPPMSAAAVAAPSMAAMPGASPSGAAPMPATTPTTASTTPSPVRIKAGATNNITDADGNVWLPDQGFEEGETVERPDAEIVGSKSPQIYRSEHWGMSSFTYPVPNGKYIVKLHFCETYDGITGPGDRVFSFNVQGQDFKDFDVWAKSGGYLHPYVETVPIVVTDGKVHITFTPKVQNPEVNGIEILPAP